METTTKNFEKMPIGKYLYYGVIMTTCFLFTMKDGRSQNTYSPKTNNLGLSISCSAGADGYGNQYSPMLYYKRSRSHYSLGPVIQHQQMNLSGIRFDYDYTLISSEFLADDNLLSHNNLEIFSFATSTFCHNALLGKRAAWEEGVVCPERKKNVSELRFKSVEIYAGFGSRIKLCRKIKWVNNVGFGGYVSIDSPENLYYSTSNVGLFLKTGFSIDF